MGFIRNGNYKNNTIEKVVKAVKLNIRSELENVYMSGKSAGEAKEFARQLIKTMSTFELIIEDLCYIGITANPVQSLTAHGIDVNAENTFWCVAVPSECASECRAEISALDGFDPYIDEANDYIDYSFEKAYIYIYKISDKTNEIIDNSGFTPLMQLPQRPITIIKAFVDGASETRYYDAFSHDDHDRVINDIMGQVRNNYLTELVIIHRDQKKIFAEFGTDCCIVNYESGTSRSGHYQSYRSGVRSRKMVRLFNNEYPEYMVCRDLGIFENIISIFLDRSELDKTVKFIAQ